MAMEHPTTAADAKTRRRPVVLIPARFSESASALRYRAEVAARALVEAVYRAGGEPLLMHPHAPGGQADQGEVRARPAAVADAVLLPGGGDLDPSWSGQQPHASQYDVDIEQDAFDLAVAEAALDGNLPLLAICRGMQVVNVLLGGQTVQDMDEAFADPGTCGTAHHRHRKHEIQAASGSLLANTAGPTIAVSCYHHQCLGQVGGGLEIVARAQDGVIEGVELPSRRAWFLGVQWHPEDTAAEDPAQAAVFAEFIRAAARSDNGSSRRGG